MSRRGRKCTSCGWESVPTERWTVDRGRVLCPTCTARTELAQCCRNHDGAHVHGCTRPRQPNGAEHPGGCIIRTGDSRPSELIYERLAEQGRKLASQRDDLIAQGVDPADLDVPMHPGSGDPS